MGLADRYKETLGGEGINVKINATKKDRDRTKFYVALVIFVFGLPLFFMISQNYSYCTTTTASITRTYGENGVNGSFYLKCGTDTTLYSVVALLVLVIAAMFMVKIIKYRRM